MITCQPLISVWGQAETWQGKMCLANAGKRQHAVRSSKVSAMLYWLERALSTSELVPCWSVNLFWGLRGGNYVAFWKLFAFYFVRWRRSLPWSTWLISRISLVICVNKRAVPSKLDVVQFSVLLHCFAFALVWREEVICKMKRRGFI